MLLLFLEKACLKWKKTFNVIVDFLWNYEDLVRGSKRSTTKQIDVVSVIGCRKTGRQCG